MDRKKLVQWLIVIVLVGFVWSNPQQAGHVLGQIVSKTSTGLWEFGREAFTGVGNATR
jgi:hypothetical protein